jgi:glycosyltransferase involved in cell wall biosynthesis
LPYYLPFSPVIGLYGGDLFKQFPIPKSRIYVVGMGTANYRKGFDMFVEIAKHTWQKDQEYHFTWIGGFVDAEMDAWYRSAQSAEMSEFFLLTGTLPRNLELLKGMDIFLLTSREDPYPLVVIEAAQMSLPSIYFSGAGGIGDFVGSDCGWPVAGFSIAKVVDLLLSLKESRSELVEKGNNAKIKAQRIHEDGAGIINKCFEIIDELI